MSTLDDALARASVTWAKPVLHADWENDGYDGDGSIDDLTDQLGSDWSVTHAFADGMPTDVTDATVQPLGQMSSSLTGRAGRTGPGGPESAGRYFSRFNSTSPVAGFDRDVAAVTLDHGPIATDGPQRTRLFTGQMADIPVTSRTASLQAVSATNRRLQMPVQPPAVDGTTLGLTASWPVSYALQKCGLNVSPPPRPGCRWWAPMHGSLAPMIPDRSLNNPLGSPPNNGVRPTFVDGPFLEAAYAALPTGAASDEVTEITVEPFPFNGAFGGLRLTTPSDPDLLSKTGAGRLEMWVRGDALDASAIPGGGSQFVLWHQHNLTGGAEVLMGIDTSRHPFCQLIDGSGHTTTLTSVSTLPTDSGWYFVGAAYDVAAKKLWVKYNNTTVETASASTLVTTALPDHDYYLAADVAFTFLSWAPIAEVQVTAGVQANADNFPVWANSTSYWDPSTSKVVMRPSQNRGLQVLAEAAPVRAVDYLQQWANAEVAMTRCDEQDRYCWLPMRYWVETAQQTQTAAITSLTTLADLNVGYDVTRLRNSVSLTYRQARVDAGFTIVYSDSSVLAIPPGEMTVTYTLQYPIVELANPAHWGPDQNHGSFIPLDPTSMTIPTDNSYFTANTKADGTGAYLVVGGAGGLDGVVYDWTPGSVTVVFTNSTNGTLYLVNTTNSPTLAFAGRRATFTDGVLAPVKDSGSIAAGGRGERGLTVTLPGVQDPDWATFMAGELCARLAWPRWRATNVRCLGDPRRKPGDVVKLQDAYGTAINDLGRVMTVNHEMRGARYGQTLTIVQFWPAATWDAANWNYSLWGA